VDEVSSSGNHQRIIRTSRQWTELVYFPSRTSLRIERVHWDRLKRCVSNIPDTGRVRRDVAFTCLGIAVPTLLAAIALPFTSVALPTWLTVLNWVVVVVTFTVSVLCLRFDKEMGFQVSQCVSDVLQDMKDIEANSAWLVEEIRDEEKGTESEAPPCPPPPPTTS
jgi:hypothetical protein